VDALTDELRLLRAAFRRRPLAPPEGAFSTTQRSRMGQMIVVLIVLSLFEAPALHLLLHAANLAAIRHIDSRSRDALRVSSMDTPNVELELRRPVTLRSYFGLRRSASKLQLFVDDPHAFVADLTRRI
jgi:hypothetical protein